MSAYLDGALARMNTGARLKPLPDGRWQVIAEGVSWGIYDLKDAVKQYQRCCELLGAFKDVPFRGLYGRAG